jgi:hypothetical protein
LRKQQAELEMLRNRWSQALAIHRQREADSRGYGAAKGQSRRVLGGIRLYPGKRMGQAQEAVTMLRRIVPPCAAASSTKMRLSLWEARAFLGVALAAAGERDEALQLLNTAVPRVLEIARGERSSSEAGVLRTARFNWMLDGYINLLAEQARAGDAQALDQAFRMADLARGSTVQRALSAFAQRAGISDPANWLPWRAREQDQQREISNLSDAIGNLLARGRIAEQDKDRCRHAGDLVAPACRACRVPGRNPAAVPELLVAAESAAGGYRCGAEAAARRRGDGLRLHRQRTYPCLGDPGPGQSQALPWSRWMRRRSMPGSSQLRASLDPEAESSGRTPRYPFDTAYDLYRQLLAPVESGWKGASELIVIPHGRLGQLPFGVLTTSPFRAPAAKLAYAEMADAPWLLKQVAISQLPAAIALPLLRGANSRNARNCLSSASAIRFSRRRRPAPVRDSRARRACSGAAGWRQGGPGRAAQPPQKRRQPRSTSSCCRHCPKPRTRSAKWPRCWARTPARCGSRYAAALGPARDAAN